MRKNTAKEKLLRGEVAYGFSVGSGSPIVAESLSHTGADWVMVDTQHGSWGPESTLLSLMGISTGTAVPFARVTRNEYAMIGRLLDEGAMGIIIPNVDNPEQAKAAADACRFPPRGTRSVGWGRARNLGSDYATRIDDEVFVAVQIELPEGVEKAEAILGVDGVNGCFIGPADLMISMGLDPKDPASAPKFAVAIDRVLQACRNTGKVPGISCMSPADTQARVKQGFRLVTVGNDMLMLLGKATDNLKQGRTEAPPDALASPGSTSGY